MAVPALPPDRLERVCAWGGTACVMSWVYRPATVEGIVRVFETARAAGITVGLRGAGQSYGDAALAAENVCLDLSRMTRILDWDPERGVVRAEPGVTIGQLWRHTIEDGFWPWVVPGTMFVSLGGAAAMNVHGKNAWKVGPIGDHLLEIEVLLPSGEIRRCTRDAHPDLFHAVIGGFGALGCIVSLTLALEPVHSGLLRVEPLAAPDLGAMLEIFEERQAHADYLVGWIDCFARAPALGRGLVHQAIHLAPGEDPRPAQTLRPASQELPATLFGVVPRSVVWRLTRPLTNDLGIRLINAAKYRLGAREAGHAYLQPHAAFAFLLDYVPDWKRAYGPGGLIQYQSFIPAAHAADAFREMLALAHRRRVLPYLGVLKRHRRDDFLMGHGVDGYSLALDIRVTRRTRERVWALAAELDRIVLDAGGRFYPAKDSTLGPETYARSLGPERIERFLALKRACDPEGLLATDLQRRLLAPLAGA